VVKKEALRRSFLLVGSMGNRRLSMKIESKNFNFHGHLILSSNVKSSAS
jgi:hypothetical protein